MSYFICTGRVTGVHFLLNWLIAELISVELPHEYEKETWQLNDDERSNTIKENRELGNELYRNGKIAEAEEKYRAALAIIEQLLIK